MIGTGNEEIAAASTQKRVEVLLNTVKMKFPDAKPFQAGPSSVMVPIRFVSKALQDGESSKVGMVSKEHIVEPFRVQVRRPRSVDSLWISVRH